MLLAKFRNDWLESRLDLPRPKAFVLCTSAILTDTAEWERAKNSFRAETGVVAVEEWHRHMLDGWLKDQPGIVGELFGDGVAGLFCPSARNWGSGLFRPIDAIAADRTVKRFLTLRDAGKIIRLPKDEQRFGEILVEKDQSTVLLAGLAGTGKTMAALDLALNLASNHHCVYFLCPEETQDVDRLLDGIRSRAFRPAIFVLDDCHKAATQVEHLLNRLASTTARSKIKLVLTARTPPSGQDALTALRDGFRRGATGRRMRHRHQS